MQNKTVHINHMKLRIAGVNENQALQIGQEVAVQLSETLPFSFPKSRPDSINLTVNVIPGISSTDISKSITEAILKGLV